MGNVSRPGEVWGGPAQHRGRNSKLRFLCVYPQIHRIYLPSFIDVGQAFSEPLGFENVDTARTDIWPVLCHLGRGDYWLTSLPGLLDGENCVLLFLDTVSEKTQRPKIRWFYTLKISSTGGSCEFIHDVSLESTIIYNTHQRWRHIQYRSGNNAQDTNPGLSLSLTVRVCRHSLCYMDDGRVFWRSSVVISLLIDCFILYIT